MKKIGVFGFLLATNAFAQNIPPLPGPVQPGLNDTVTFICDVSTVNEDFMDRSRNLWTTAARGGKFTALSPTKLRVMSSSETSAAAETYDFYKRYAASAYIKSPMYDRGTRLTQKFVVSSCVVDKSRSTKVNLKQIPLNSYKLLLTANEHILNFLAFNKTPLTDEQIASMVSENPFSTDAFERNDQIQKAASRARNASKKNPERNVILEGRLLLGEYDFEKKSFDLSNLKRGAEEYLYKTPAGSGTRTPTYDLTVPNRLMTYAPSSLDEAKKIEGARNKMPYMKLKTYIQVTEASNMRGPIISATIAAIEVYTDKGELMFKLSAR